MSRPLKRPAPATRPERWVRDARDAVEAVLTIPADALRQRRFEIACAMTVALPADAPPGAWHAMTVHVDGALQWSRRVPTHNPGETDGLELRFERSVAVGRALRVVVAVTGQGVRRRRLIVEADEV